MSVNAAREYARSMVWWYKTGLHRFRKKWNNCHIELPNGAKCNHAFYMLCFDLGILSEDD